MWLMASTPIQRIVMYQWRPLPERLAMRLMMGWVVVIEQRRQSEEEVPAWMEQDMR